MNVTFDGSERGRIGGAAMALLLVCAFAISAAGETPKPRGGRPPQKEEVHGFVAKPLLDADLSALDNELAQYMQFRGDVGAEGVARLELLIDLRVLARWSLIAATNAKPESELQAGAALRADELLRTANVLAQHFKTGSKPTADQISAMAKIHALTFDLKELKQLAQADDICREVGSQITVAAGPLPPDVRQITLMRPAAKIPSGPATSTGPAERVDPISRANLLTVSAPLKKQVVALATAADAVKGDLTGGNEKKHDEAAALAEMTNRALEIAEGMSRNTGLDAQSRPRLEQQMADGLALFLDPRMRGPGRQRIATLDVYAQTLSRIRGLNLKPEVQQRLAPLFVWSAEHGEDGQKLMSVVEAYLVASRRMDTDAAPTQPPLAAREAKAAAEALKRCGVEREEFLSEVAGLSRSGNLVESAAFAIRVQSMRENLDLAEACEHAPTAMQTLLALHPKPTGGLERRMGGAMASLGEPRASAGRDEAARTVADIVKIAGYAAELESPPPVPADVAQTYAHNKLAPFDARRRDVVTELASLLASGKEMDISRLQRIEQMRSLRDALGEVALFEAALHKAEPLSRWADWPIDATDYQAIFDPYRQDVANLFETYSTAEGPLQSQWLALHARYGPAMRLIIRASVYADACTVLPTGWPGQAGRLMTPFDAPAFSQERKSAFALKIWSRYEQSGETRSAAAIGDALAARLHDQ